MNCTEIHSKELDNYGRFNILHCIFLVVCSVNEHKCLCETCDLEAVGDSEEGQSAGKKRRKRNNSSCTYRSILHKTQVVSRTCSWWRCYYEHKTKDKYIREYCCRPLNGFRGDITITFHLY